jgi:negative regulator of flagellin synthesis FlgM
MNIHINGLTGSSRTEAPSSPNKTRSSESVGVAATTQPPVAKESVTLTSIARTITDTARDNTNMMPFNEEKVAAIKTAIMEGRYPLDNKKIAQKMLDFEHQLARRPSK